MGSTDASRMLAMRFVVRIACSVAPTVQASFGRRLGSTVDPALWKARMGSFFAVVLCEAVAPTGSSPIVRNATRIAFQGEKLQIILAVFMRPNV